MFFLAVVVDGLPFRTRRSHAPVITLAPSIVMHYTRIHSFDIIHHLIMFLSFLTDNSTHSLHSLSHSIVPFREEENNKHTLVITEVFSCNESIDFDDIYRLDS